MFKPSALLNSFLPLPRLIPKWGAVLGQGRQLLRRRWYLLPVVAAVIALNVWLVANSNAKKTLAPPATVTGTWPGTESSLTSPVITVDRPGAVGNSGSQPAQPAHLAEAEAETAFSLAPTSPGKGTAGTGSQMAPPPVLDLQPGDLLKPVPGRVSQEYGFNYSRVFEDFRLHKGVDLAAPDGQPVKASLAGEVSAVNFDELYQYRVVITHSDGWQTVYAQLRQVTVAEGQVVDAGEIIGAVGPAGGAEFGEGSHLHLELLRDGSLLDPLVYLRAQ